MTIKVGYHGTTLENARKLEARDFTFEGDRTSRWLGSGLYFFEDNLELAFQYAEAASGRHRKQAGIFKAEIDTSSCLDATRLTGKNLLRNAYNALNNEWNTDPSSRITQDPFSLIGDQVRSGYEGDWAGGRNSLDYAVVERAIRLGREQKRIVYDTVRGIFIEESPLFPSSWMFDGAHVAIAVRNPDLRIGKCSAMEL